MCQGPFTFPATGSDCFFGVGAKNGLIYCTFALKLTVDYGQIGLFDPSALTGSNIGVEGA